ncbi:MAG: helix-turn-helix transcriptional regulator [Gammaproteobacteria bacterium]|nr:helix-turn-helix transcriptional regulator [Gammaproteobacteria bacterium]MBI5617443.1 helix-turn-helix transcriptional regulator [Gammaproteobacteria bacterium]
MVKYSHETLDRTFSALADPTRRALLARLGTEDDVSVSALSRPFALSLPAVMKHLKVLELAGLITQAKQGRTVSCRLRPNALDEAQAWLDAQREFWNARLDRLAAALEEEPCPTPKTRASRSRAASPRRPRASSRPGPSRK